MENIILKIKELKAIQPEKDWAVETRDKILSQEFGKGKPLPVFGFGFRMPDVRHAKPKTKNRKGFSFPKFLAQNLIPCLDCPIFFWLDCLEFFNF